MMVKYAVLEAIVLACAVAIQGTSANPTACSGPDMTRPVCQTSGGSPLAADCQKAFQQLVANSCVQSNYGGGCQTLITVGTCKIDVCAPPGSKVVEGVNCKGYFQSILNSCTSNGRVGGYLQPAACNTKLTYYGNLRLQFSHR